EAPPNTAPTLTYNRINQIHTFIDGSLTAHLGEQIDIALAGTDPDNVPTPDLLRLELIEAGGTVEPEGYIFSPAEGMGSVTSTFSWLPDCSIFKEGIYENQYEFKFRVYDSRCWNVKGDTVVVNITIRDVESDLDAFNPPNIITPNGDGCNDFFAFEGFEPATGP